MSKRNAKLANSVENDGSAPGSHKVARTSAAVVTPRRRITSCAACRRQKIKCELLNDEPPCERCRRKGIECIINTSLRNSILDQRQIAALRRDIGHLHSSLNRVCQHLSIDAPPALETPLSVADTPPSQLGRDSAEYDDGSLYQSSPPQSPTIVHAPMDSYLAAGSSDASALKARRSQITGLTHPPSSPSPSKPRWRQNKRPLDLVSKGLITFEEADTLVQSYLKRLDKIVYCLCGAFTSTQSVRDASPALLSIMCTVASLYTINSQHLYDVCCQEFRSLVSAALFERRDIEHVRALTIGSFWLPDASRILLGDAVRRAGDGRIYRHITRIKENVAAAGGDPAAGPAHSLDRVRLWYALFICDQHLSVLHNKDRLMPRRRDVLDTRETFLASTGKNIEDLRLIGQVSILLIMTRIKDAFGSEYPTPVLDAQSSQVEQFTKEIDSWYSWIRFRYESDFSTADLIISGFPMHHQFAKLYLGQHVLRGLRSDDAISTALLGAASMAYNSALRIFDMIKKHDNVRAKLASVPIYVLVMISFAGHLLLEMCLKHRQQLRINVESDYRCLISVVASFRVMKTAQTHPLHRVNEGLSKRLAEFAAAYGKELLTESGHGAEKTAGELNTPVEESAHNQGDVVFGLDSSMMLDSFSFTDFGSFNFGVPFPDLNLT